MTTNDPIRLAPVDGTSFGVRCSFAGARGAEATVLAAEKNRQALLDAFYTAGGLLLLEGMEDIRNDPALLVRLSRLFGTEVEDYRQTIRARHSVHPEVPEILLIAGKSAGAVKPPPRPDPPMTAEGTLPIQFPHRRGWHTDQSFRRPPPDVSVFLAVVPSPRDQGQTLFADGTAAYESLPADLKVQVEGLEGLHVMPGAGRAEQDVRAGKTPDPLRPHERPQRQPVVRVHPVTGKRALYLCEAGQMDWIEGPLVGYETGPDGAGAALLYRLMHHFTGPEFTYAHHWNKGDLVIYDNRSLIHSATWYDAENHERIMWRTTVHGNPGPLYDGEAKSWIA
jgi:taurine dioxygenase